MTKLEEPNCSMNGRPGSIISYTYKTKLKIKSCISPCEWWEIYHWVYRVPSLKSRTALFPSSVKVTIASEDISPRTLSLSATKHDSWVSTVLHLVVCCVGWVHSSISSESSQVAKTSCWLEKSIFASSLSLAHCVLETTELWQMLPILECLGTVHWLNSLLLEITWGMASLTLIKLSKLTNVQPWVTIASCSTCKRSKHHFLSILGVVSV